MKTVLRLYSFVMIKRGCVEICRLRLVSVRISSRACFHLVNIRSKITDRRGSFLDGYECALDLESLLVLHSHLNGVCASWKINCADSHLNEKKIVHLTCFPHKIYA